MENANDTKAELINALIDAGALIHGKFILSSGRESTYYIDIKKAFGNPLVLAIISRKICEILPTLDRIDAVAGVELGGVPIVTAVSLEYGLPMIIVRKETKNYGIKVNYIGEPDKKRVVMVEDVTTEGGSVMRAIENLRRHGSEIDTVITVADRGEGARENLKKIDVELIALVNHSELMENNYHNKDNLAGDGTH